MKKLFRLLLCTGLMAVLLSVPAFAAQTTAPAQKQGDFYVLVNGEYVTFSDAVPKLKDGRSFLPFVAVLDQLGFAQQDMTWDGASGTVTAAKGDSTIALTIGKSQITLTQAGQTSVIDTDAAPYVDPATSRTYVPFGLVADALGYRVGWDAQQGTVIIDDMDAILAANTATYHLMDQYLDYAKAFSQGSQKVSGKYAMDFALNLSAADQRSAILFDLDGKYDSVTANSSAFQFSTELSMSPTLKENGADITHAALGEAASLFPMKLDMDLRGDLDSGTFYFQSAALAQMLEQPGLASVWYKMDLNALFDQMGGQLGMDYAGLLRLSKEVQNMSFEEYLSSTLALIPLTDASCTTSQVLDIVNALCADSAFTKSGSSYVNKLDLGGLDPSLAGSYLTFTLYTSGGKVNGYGLDMAIAPDDVAAMNIRTQMKGKKMDVKMSFDISEDEDMALSLSMTMDGAYQSTSAKPATQPPAGAVVIDLNELAGGYVPLPRE